MLWYTLTLQIWTLLYSVPTIVSSTIFIETKVVQFFISPLQDRKYDLLSNILPALNSDFNALAFICNALRL